MTPEEARRAIEEIAASPTLDWIVTRAVSVRVGSRVTVDALVQRCKRCDVQSALALPTGVSAPPPQLSDFPAWLSELPAWFDEELLRWKRTFQIAHEGCPAQPTPAEAA